MLLITLSISLIMLLYMKRHTFSSITRFRRVATTVAAGLALVTVSAASALAQQPQGEGAQHRGGESSLILPVHRSMLEISEMIYETCKTYLITQGKFILILWGFIATIIVLYFGVLAPVPGKPLAVTLPIILLFSLVGIVGSYGVAWFGIRVNTFANSRTAFASLEGR